MSNIKKWGIMLLLLPLSSYAQQSSPMTLDTIIYRIERNNPLLESFGLKAERFKHLADASTAWMAPMVGVGTFMTPYPGQQIMSDDDKGSIMLQMEQDIPNISKLKAKKKYIISQSEAELVGRDISMNDFKAQAKKLYYGWIVALQKINILHQNERILKRMKDIEEVRYPYNKSKLGSVYRIESELEENANMIRMQQGEISKSRAWLNSLMNVRGDAALEIDTTIVPSYHQDAYIDTAMLASSRMDIKQMEYNIASMHLNIAAMKKEKLPDFKIRYDHMTPIAGMMPNSYSIMGMVTIPIAPWSSKMYKSEIKSMQYEIQAMEKERTSMLQSMQGMVYGMKYEIQSMQAQIQAMEKTIIPTLEKTLDVNFLSYRENKMELPEVILTWEALTMAQDNVLNEKLKLYLMYADYEKELYR